MRHGKVRVLAVGCMLAALVGWLPGFATAGTPADTYVLYTDRVPATLDPARAYEAGASEVLENLYETLLTFDRDAADALVPGLATSYAVSEDGRTYTFALREGVTFHSGHPLTCRDAEYTFERGLVTAHPEGAFRNLLVPRVLGVESDGSDPEAYAAEAGFRAIDAAIVCVDDLTLRIRLVGPDPGFPAVLAYPAFGIVDAAWAIAHGQWDGTAATWTEWIGRDLTAESLHAAASGTGAYRLASWEDDVLVAERFHAYWGEAPQLERVVIRFVADQSLRVLALRQGDADRIVLSDRAFLSQLRDAPGVSVHTSSRWTPATTDVVLFNYAIDVADNPFVGSGRLDGAGIPPEFFTDPDVRKGLAHLVDHERLIADVLQGDGVALTMALPPSFPGYAADAPLRTLDLPAAEAHFRRAFDGRLWDVGFAFTALGIAGRDRQALDMIGDHLERLNPRFRLSVAELVRPEFFAQLVAGHAPMVALGWSADHADPANFLHTFYASSGAAALFTHIGFDELDAILERAGAAQDPAERAALYARVGPLQHELVPLLPLPLGSPFLATRSDLQGVYYHPLRSGAFLWRDVGK